MKTQFWAIALVICGTIVGSGGGLLLKIGADEIPLSFWNIVQSRKIISAIVLYVASSFLFIWALRGGELSVLYPMVSLSYVWILGMSHFILKERINLLKLIGICFIIVGVTFVGLGN